MLVVAATAFASAASDDHRDLLRRVAAANGASAAALRVADGVLPPGFAGPNPAPALAILGSSWIAGTNPPERVRIYYRPAPETGAQLSAIGASLKARGYVRSTASGFANLFVGDEPATQRWCPPGYGPALFLTLVHDGARRALDVDVMPSSAEPCASAARRDAAAGAAPLPVLGNIPGLTIEAPSRAVAPGRIASTAVVRSSLLQSSVLARLAARFAAAGWRAEPAVVEGEATAQRFTRAGTGSSWVVDLRLEQRSPGVYDAIAVATASPA